MTEHSGVPGPGGRPTLAGPRVTIRPGRPADVERLREILAEPSVSTWWGEPEPADVIAARLLGEDPSVLLVVEAGGDVAGGELDPRLAGRVSPPS